MFKNRPKVLGVRKSTLPRTEKAKKLEEQQQKLEELERLNEELAQDLEGSFANIEGLDDQSQQVFNTLVADFKSLQIKPKEKEEQVTAQVKRRK
jgi:hypothetical protein